MVVYARVSLYLVRKLIKQPMHRDRSGRTKNDRVVTSSLELMFSTVVRAC